MANRARRRTLGTAGKRASGRWQARDTGPDGKTYSARRPRAGASRSEPEATPTPGWHYSTPKSCATSGCRQPNRRPRRSASRNTPSCG
jgi:hypothetical protein